MSKLGSFGVVMGHPMSLKIASFDRAHKVPISLPYQVCPYLAPFLRYNEILVENRQIELTPPLVGVAVGAISLEFRRDFGIRKLWSPWARSLVWRCLCDPSFSHLCRTPTCGTLTDRRMAAYTALA